MSRSIPWILTILIWVASCSEPPCGCAPPPILNFIVLDAQGNPLFTSVDTPVEVSYILNGKQTLGKECAGGGCKMIRDFNHPSYKFCYSSMEAFSKSADFSVRNFYITINNDVDTLYVDAKDKERSQVLDVTFNGQPAIEAIVGFGEPIYVLRKK